MVLKFQDSEISSSWEDILTQKYGLRLSEIADTYPDNRSVFVSYVDIDEYNTDFAMFLLDNPIRCLEIAKKVVRTLMPPTWNPADAVSVRITKLPRDAKVEIRHLRAEHLGKLVAIDGLVRKTTSVKPCITRALFKCARCGAEQWTDQVGMIIQEPTLCSSPEGSCNKAATQFRLLKDKSVYMDTQRIEIQESPEGLRGGAQPERTFGYLRDDIAGTVFPGNRVTLNGIVNTVEKTDRDKSAVFETFIEVYSAEFEQHEYDEIQITEEDEAEIREMSRNPDLFKNIIQSISPTIFGLEMEKEAIALQLFGGSHKEMDDGTSIRGDLHILFVGDPGVAKSQLLRYMSMLAPRGIYASGKSASAAGLCVHSDTVINLESGDIKIGEFVESRIGRPEEYKPGIWRQAVLGDKTLSMTEQGSLRALPISYVWKIKTPEKLIELTTKNGDRLLLTPETRILARKDMTFDWVESCKISQGTLVSLCKEEPLMRMRFVEIENVRELTESLPEFVYDLTVEHGHSFLGNGFAVHNTAAAVKDDFGDGRWTLEAGALVLADKGLACIDELDKMSAQDRSSLHEAMESQKISVAKAGITATLQCRCSMLAAANPKRGRFDKDQSIADQIDLPPALMSRFDMIFVLTDEPNQKRDKNITEHILKAHRRGQVRCQDVADDIGIDVEGIMTETDNIKPIYTVDLMRKYVAYSKRIIPILTDASVKIIEDYYLEIRKLGEGDNASIPITARQLEAFVRLSEASARARLSRTVEIEDANRAVKIVRYYLEKIAGTSTGGFDIDRIATGISKNDREAMKIMREIFVEFGSSGGLSIDEIINHANGRGVSERDVITTVGKMKAQNEIFCPKEGTYLLV